MISQNNLPKGKAGGYIGLGITSLVWGTTWVASKIGVAEIPAIQMAAIRHFLGGISFVLFFMLYKKLPVPGIKEFGWLLIMALLMFVLANGLSTWSLKYIPTGLSALVGALYPLSVVIIEVVFFKSKNMTLLSFAGLMLGITGIGIVYYESAFQHQQGGFLFGLMLSVIAMLSWSIGTIIISRGKIKLNPYYAIGWQMLISSVILTIFSAITQPVLPLNQISMKVWEVIAYLVLAGSILSFVSFIYSMKKLPIAVASLYAYINPLVAMITAAIILNEKLTINILWGAIVTLAGVFIVNYSIKRNRSDIIAEPEQ